jgi:hypothetical protein
MGRSPLPGERCRLWCLGAEPWVELDRVIVDLPDRQVRDPDPLGVADPDAVGHPAMARIRHSFPGEDDVVARVGATPDCDVLHAGVDPQG